MFSRSFSIKICHMNLTEIYSLNSYFGILLHQSYTKLQSCCFHWTSLQSPIVGNSSEDHLPLFPQSLTGCLTTSLGPASPRGRTAPLLTLGSHGLSLWSHFLQPWAMKKGKLLETWSWALILAYSLRTIQPGPVR